MPAGIFVLIASATVSLSKVQSYYFPTVGKKKYLLTFSRCSAKQLEGSWDKGMPDIFTVDHLTSVVGNII